jgi:hypothetical protein
MIQHESAIAEQERDDAHDLITAILRELNDAKVSVSVAASALGTCLAKVLATVSPEGAEEAIKDFPDYLREAVRNEAKIGSRRKH